MDEEQEPDELMWLKWVSDNPDTPTTLAFPRMLQDVRRDNPNAFLNRLEKAQKEWNDYRLEKLRALNQTAPTTSTSQPNLPDPGTEAALNLIAELKAKIRERMAQNEIPAGGHP